MKKILFIFALTFVAITSNAQTSPKGDVDGDGTISVTDVAWIVNHILGVNNNSFISANADINGDGEIDINDVMGTVSIILGDDGGTGIGDTTQAYLTCPDDNHPHMIDLGLPSGTKWACCNVGADKPEAYGGYYAWGETETKSVYTDVTYHYATGVDEDGDGWYDDYHSDTDVHGVWQNLGSDIAGTQYDVAHVKWGGSWVMPSFDQIVELLYNSSSEWTTLNGVNGRRFTGPSGGIIFLPAAGNRINSYFNNVGSRCYCWSSTQYPSYAHDAYSLYFLSGHMSWYYDSRYIGQSVRPVFRN